MSFTEYDLIWSVATPEDLKLRQLVELGEPVTIDEEHAYNVMVKRLVKQYRSITKE